MRTVGGEIYFALRLISEKGMLLLWFDMDFMGLGLSDAFLSSLKWKSAAFQFSFSPLSLQAHNITTLDAFMTVDRRLKQR